jgi:thioredoxin reductase (NADPH)
MDTLLSFVIAAAVVLFFLHRYLKELRKKTAQAHQAAELGKLRSDGPRAQHPSIDATHCIGCGACTNVCPEGDVLAMLGGKAVIVNAHKCIGHSLCAEVCPVGAITMVLSTASMGADMPRLTPKHETTIPNLFIAGELGGLALIKNAVNQGRDCVDEIAARIPALRAGNSSGAIYDLIVVGAGPAGISASLRAVERKLHYLTIDESELGGTVAKYPRQKLVMTSPVEFPLYGKFKKTELSKEELLAFWKQILSRADFKLRGGEKVEQVAKDADGAFTIHTSRGHYRARAAVLALGRSGSPKKLGIEGEGLPKVMYRLIEADHYQNKKIVVVGGGDSAIEAAMGLAHQSGNQVTLSYRKESFTRIKHRNFERITECIREGKLTAVFNSNPIAFKPNSVILEVAGTSREIPNDYVWVFAGGEPPNAFLKKIGIGFGMRDMTFEGSDEAKQAKAAQAASSSPRLEPALR